MLASSDLVLFRQNQVAVLVVLSYFIWWRIMGENYSLDLGRETQVLLIAG